MIRKKIKIEQNSKSVSYKNNGRANKKSKAQEKAFEEFMAHFVKKPLFGFLKKPTEKAKLVHYPVSDFLKKEPDYLYLDKEAKSPVIIEVKSSLNNFEKVKDVVEKYKDTKYGGKKPGKIVLVSNSRVPVEVMRKVGKMHLDKNQPKVYVITPRMMQLPLEEELERIRDLSDKRRWEVEGYEKALLTAKEIAEVNRKKAVPLNNNSRVKKIKVKPPKKSRKNQKHKNQKQERKTRKAINFLKRFSKA